MSFELTETLATGYNPTLQPFVRDGATVGSALTPTVVGNLHTWNLSGLAAGDYDMQLSGDWEIDGPKFALRKTATAIYYADFWWQIDSAIVANAVIDPPISDSVCRVQITVRKGATGVQSRVLITCGSTGRLADSAFADVAVDDETNSGGLIQVDLPWSSVAGVGKYRFRFIEIETGNVLHDRVATVPDLETALYEDLT